MVHQDKMILDTEMETLPRRDEMLVIGEIVYEINGVRHVFKSTGRRSSQYEYVAEVRITPL